ncbi:hypothetical protein Tco_0552445, partial [Tanacetum coccineum]
FEEAESSSTAADPSNMHEFNQVQRSTHTWTKAHPLEQVIGDPSKPVMTRSRLNTDAEVCMYALSHPAKAETRGVASWISSQHNGVNNRESLNA